MKRKYIKPTIEVIITLAGTLLAGSDKVGTEGNTTTGDEVDHGGSLGGKTVDDGDEGEEGAKFHHSWSVWDEE